VARSRISRARTDDDEYREIIAWYEDLLEDTAPPTGLTWEPVKIGPTWQRTDSGWLLPEITLGWDVMAWCGKWLRDKHGHAWQFTAEQARFLLWFYALDQAGDFQFHSAVLQRLKGWGKDPLAACAAAAGCYAPVTFDHWGDGGDRPVGRDEPNAWVQVLAVSQPQTKNTMKLFPSLISPEAKARYGIQIGKENVYGLGDTRHIEAVTSSPLAVEGGRPTLVIRAETQNWLTANGGHEMAGALEGNAAKSEGGMARMLDICNAYRPGLDSVGERMREGWEATQGPDARAMDFGLMYDSLEAPPEAPLTAEAAPDVVRSIAGDATWLDTRADGRIVMSILNPANSPNESRRKWFNQVTAVADAWVDPQWFDACPGRGDRFEARDRVVLFLDCSKSDDATALVGCRISDAFVQTVGIWERPPQLKRWVVDREDVDNRLRDAFDLWDVVGFWGDPSGAKDDETGESYWDGKLDEWGRRWGDRLVLPAVKSGDHAHRVSWDMRSPTHLKLWTEENGRCLTEIKERQFRWDGHIILKQHVRNARRRPNQFGVGTGKEHRESARKIDGQVAMVGAKLMRRMYLAAGIRERSNQAMFVGRR